MKPCKVLCRMSMLAILGIDPVQNQTKYKPRSQGLFPALEKGPGNEFGKIQKVVLCAPTTNQ